MKTILFSLLAALLPFISSPASDTCAADNAPQFLPIQAGAMRTYLFSQVKEAKVWFTGDGVHHLPGKPSVITARDGSPEELLAKAGASQIVVGISNDTSPITAHCALTDASGKILIEGESRAYATKVATSEWKITADKVPLQMPWSFEVPFEAPGATLTAAQVIIRDYDGNEYAYDLDITAQGFNFHTWFRDQQGELLLTLSDGSVLVYSLMSGEKVDSVARGKSVGVLANYKEVKSQHTSGLMSGVMLVTLVESEMVETPVFRIEIKHGRKTVKLHTLITLTGAPDFKYYPQEWWFYEERWGYQQRITPGQIDHAPDGSSRLTMVLDPGIYWVYADDPIFGREFWTKG
jgi:hypothetical protein